MTFSSPATFNQGNSLPPKTSSTGKKPPRHYERQKAEKKALEAQLVELVELARQLEARSKAKKKTRANKPVNSVWKALLARNLKHRRATEQMQQFLLAAVIGNCALLDDLVGLVQQQMKTGCVLATGSPGPSSDIFLQPSDDLLFAMYIHELNGVYAQTDGVFKDCGMGSTETPEAFHQAMTTAQGTPTIEIGWKDMFPFEYQQTADAMWMLSGLIHRQDAREEFDEVKDLENTVAVKVRYTKTVEGGGCESLVHRFVQRRFVEDNRQVAVWKSSIRGDGSFRGLQIDETGWSVFCPSANGSGTLGQAYIRQVPLHLSSSNTNSTSFSMFDEFVQGMVHENSRVVTKMAESLLLDEALDNIKV